MKQLICAFSLLCLLSPGLSGQTLMKSGVSPSDTPFSQDSFKDDSRDFMLGGVVGIIVGGALVVVAETVYRDGLPDDATFTEELLGPRVMRGLCKYGGYAIMAAGGVAIFIGIDHKMRLKDNRPVSLVLSPVYIEQPDRNGYPGINFTFRF